MKQELQMAISKLVDKITLALSSKNLTVGDAKELNLYFKRSMDRLIDSLIIEEGD